VTNQLLGSGRTKWERKYGFGQTINLIARSGRRFALIRSSVDCLTFVDKAIDLLAQLAVLRNPIMFQKERRSERRYLVQQPAFLKLEDGSEVVTISQNVSTYGLLLRCESLIALRSRVKIDLRLPNGLPLEGRGEVLRVEQPSAGGAFLIAVRCEEPLEISR
jgi:hypothetical protein